MEQHPTCAPPPAPAPAQAPVPVAWAVVPVDFKVVKKGPEMAMHDATCRLAFRVAGSAGGATALQDDAGGVLVTVRSSGQGEWQAFSGNSLEQTHIIFTAKVISASSSRKEVHVFISPRSTVEDSKPSYRLIGSTFRRACTIIKGDSMVAQTNLLYKLKKTIYSRHPYIWASDKNPAPFYFTRLTAPTDFHAKLELYLLTRIVVSVVQYLYTSGI
ncbi:protein LURP-one-related 7-like isoform X2 [Miscanthus floridulus]|uniref:protein LURP-one-related 7-like isoform X2 n=1 Tax=Miscanthus floridulus TaxID=154761 RepID=UPI00345784D2